MGYLSKKEALNRIRDDAFEGFPVRFELETVGGSVGSFWYDWVLQGTWEDGVERFVVEYKHRATPRALRNAVCQVKEYARASGNSLRPMVMAPYLNKENLETLKAEDVSALDLSGNGVIQVPGEWFIWVSGNPNRYPESTSIKNVFRGTSSLVPRAFLVQPVFQSVTAIVDFINENGGSISQSTVSKVLKRLEEQLLISRNDDIKLLNPAELLDRLTQNYQVPAVTRTMSGKMLSNQAPLTELYRRVKEENESVAGLSADQYTVLAEADDYCDIFVTSIRNVLKGLDFKETDIFPTVVLKETDEPHVYFDARETDQFIWCSPVETYLELNQGDKREREAADQIRERILNSVSDSLEVD